VRAHFQVSCCKLLTAKPIQHRPPNQFIAPVQEPYTYIIFRASEVKDLAVDEQVPPVQHSVLDDPAVIGVRDSIRIFFVFGSFFFAVKLSPIFLGWEADRRILALPHLPILSPSFSHN
jgi:hypothetical protein